MDRLTLIETFIQVADYGSFSKAAARQGVSKSVVSKYVSALEDRLGAKLFHRTTRKLALTEVGATYLERCRVIIEELEEAEQSVGQLHAEPRGVLRLNAPMSFGQRHLAPALPALMEKYPDLTIDMSMSDRLVDLMDEGFDVAIRIGKLADSSLIARRLAPMRLCLHAAPAYVERYGAPQHPSDLKHHSCLGYSLAATLQQWLLIDQTGAEYAVDPPIRLRADNGDALAEAAIAGAGLVILPTFITYHHVKEGRLVRLLPDWEGPSGAIHAVYPQSRYLSAKVRVFVDHFKHYCGNGAPYWDRDPY